MCVSMETHFVVGPPGRPAFKTATAAAAVAAAAVAAAAADVCLATTFLSVLHPNEAYVAACTVVTAAAAVVVVVVVHRQSPLGRLLN